MTKHGIEWEDAVPLGFLFFLVLLFLAFLVAVTIASKGFVLLIFVPLILPILIFKYTRVGEWIMDKL
jgi:uncharacterized protein (DUF2062 family)